jgi:hypothetical protein
MGDRPRSLPGCTEVGTKVRRKDWCWSVGLVYDLRELAGVTIVWPRVTGVLHRPTIGGLSGRTSSSPWSLI